MKIHPVHLKKKKKMLGSDNVLFQKTMNKGHREIRLHWFRVMSPASSEPRKARLQNGFRSF